MLFNASVLFAVFAVSAKLVSATPPACLLAAVNTQPNPSDLHAICSSHAHVVESNIKSMCGDNTGAAMNAFTSICKANGIAVVASTSDSSSKPTTGSSSQKTASSTPMSTMMTMASGSATPVSSMAGSSPTGMSSSASAKPTHNAGGRLHAEEFASLALAAAGLALFL